MSVPGEELTQQDANIEESSAPQESADSQPHSAQAERGPEPESQQSKPVPFHEDPRVQEYVERQVRRQTESYEQRLAEMQRSFEERFRSMPQPEKPKNPFIAKLAEIDPVYGQTMEDIYNKAQTVDELKQELAVIKSERIKQQYESTVERLHGEHKIPEEIRSLVREQLDALAMSGQIRDLKEVPNVYKAVADKYSKLIDSVRRSTTASYVAEKSKDASAPVSQPKGKTPARNEKGQFTGDKEQDMALIVKRAMNRAKASSEL